MTYEQAMRFWLGRVNFEQRSAQPADLKLDRMRVLLELLGNPHRRLRIVHIAGSKGKGSTSAMLATVLGRAGYRTGLFTSPHLVHVEERFQVDGKPITHEELTSLLCEVKEVCERPETRRRWPQDLGAELTFFEIATAVGFLFFVRRRVQVAVLEVGLGGRFDSTNVCDALLAIITNISFDHMQQLGPTLDRIAAEKAGIIKPRQRVLSGVRAGEARSVIRTVCQERRANLREIDVDFHYRHQPARIGTGEEWSAQVEITTAARTWPTMPLGLLGDHQAANAALVVAAVEELRRQGLHIGDQAVAAGVARVHWPARLEVVARQPIVLLDCAHNDASALALVQTLLTSFPLEADGKRILVFASSRDKEVRRMLEILAPHFDHLFLTQFHNSPRFVSPEQAVELLPASSPPHTICEHAGDALARARTLARQQDLICVTGSVFLAGELRPGLITGEIAPAGP